MGTMLSHRSIARLLAGVIMALVICCCATSTGFAHELAAGVGTQTTFTVRDGQVTILFNLGWSVPAGFPVLANLDADGDERVEEDEWRPYLEAKIHALLPLLDLRVNGQPITLELLLIEQAGLQGSVRARPFDAYFTLRGRLPEMLSPESPIGGGWWLHWRDGTFLDQTSSQFSWIPVEDHDPDLSFFILDPRPETFEDQGAFIRTPGRTSILYFFQGSTSFDPFNDSAPSAEQLSALSVPVPPLNSQPPAAQEPVRPRPLPATVDPGSDEKGEEEQIGGIVETIVLGEAAPWEVLMALLLAVIYGAGHALGPGHGKTMVAAYLVGTRGRIRDAVTLGMVVTFAHTASIFLLGLLLLSLIEASTDKSSSATYQNWLTTIFSFGSGALLTMLGVFLARRRWRAVKADGQTDGHSHDHSHGHSHDHSHVPADWSGKDEVRFRDLVTLGFSGGIVPCPAGFTIVLVAAHFQALLLGLVVLSFFSFGLGLMLIGIGCVLVVGKERWLDRVGGSLRSRFLRLAPVASAILVSMIGVWFCFDSIARGQQPIAQMLRALARQLEG